MKHASQALLLVGAIVAAAVAAGSISAVRPVFMIAVPYAAFAVLIVGLSWRVVSWSLAPVPFRIPTVCGQQQSLPWIQRSRLESPTTTAGVVGRMAFEILTFRSLFRNTGSRLEQGPKLIYREAKWLWLGAIVFHWSLLVILLRHLRLFIEPTPRVVLMLENLDGFFRIGAPVLYLTDMAVVAAILYLIQRRLRQTQIRYISLLTDYFALFLLLCIAISGIWMRYFARTDVVAVKQFALGLTVFAPVIPVNLGVSFYIHLGLVSSLAVYLPFSKLVHMGGVFLSPTRNLANNNRMKRHINPWNYPVKVHTYEEWEDEFRDKMEAAGLPVDKKS
jgi:nitrate reductase gamma subunit